MFGQIVTLLITYFAGRLNQAGHEDFLATLSIATLRKAFFMLGAAVIGLVLFVGGFLTILTDLILSSHGQEQLYLSNVSWVGFGLIVISGVEALVLTRQGLWQTQAPKVIDERQPSPLNEALAKLVMDFVEERRGHRLHPEEENYSEATHAGSSEPPPAYM